MGLDYRSHAQFRGSIVLQIQPAYRHFQLPEGLPHEPPAHLKELFLSSDEIVFIAEKDIYGFEPIDVILDYGFGEDQSMGVYPCRAYTTNTDSDLFCRRQLSSIFDESGRITFTPLCHTHPIRGELEIKTFGRNMFVEQWDTTRTGIKSVSVP